MRAFVASRIEKDRVIAPANLGNGVWYPNVHLDESKMIVRSDRFVTAGTALSHMDLTVWLIRQKSPELAALTAEANLLQAGECIPCPLRY